MSLIFLICSAFSRMMSLSVENRLPGLKAEGAGSDFGTAVSSLRLFSALSVGTLSRLCGFCAYLKEVSFH